MTTIDLPRLAELADDASVRLPADGIAITLAVLADVLAVLVADLADLTMLEHPQP
jgi:hypothetical protein